MAADFFFWNAKTPLKALKALKRHPELGCVQTLVLLCTRPSDRQVAETVAAFRSVRKNAEIIVCADHAHWSGELAIACLKAQARDFLVEGIHDGILKRQIGLAKHGKPAYGSYQWSSGEGLNIVQGKAFVAMPYPPPQAYEDFLCGLVPALEGLGMQPFLSTDQRSTTPLPLTVQRQIRESDLLIANVSCYGRPGNPNVALELGYALGQGIPTMLIQRADDKDTYVDLRGLELLTYQSCADLAVKLYVGLRPCIAENGNGEHNAQNQPFGC